MKKLLLLISFIIFHVYSYTQTDVQRDNRVSPVLKSALNQKNGYVIYGRDNSSRFINIAVLNQSSHTMNWFTCHGRLFDSTRLTDLEYEQVTLKKLDPFALYQHICNEYLADIGMAKDIFRLNGDNKLIDSLNPNYHALFASEGVRMAKTPLQKLIAIDNLRKHILIQQAYLNCSDPFRLENTPLFKINKEHAGTMIQTRDSTVYYNIDPTSAVAKISLRKNSPEKLYIYNRLSQVIDSVPVLPEKYDLLLKEKTDVFLLYRGWLELQWQSAMSNIMRYIKEIDANDTALYRNTNIKDKKAIAKELYSQLNAIETKINVLISPEAKRIEQAIYDTYKNETSEISYIPLLGIGYELIEMRGQKEYELTNHLGNVLATVSDKKLGHSSNDSTVDYYDADIVSAQDYYPFGMVQPNRSYLSPTEGDRYRYGFNGKENDNEVKGEGNQQDYGMRMYDPRLGRFLSVDPLTPKYPELTPYQFASNSPIAMIDIDGKEGSWYNWDSKMPAKERDAAHHELARIGEKGTKVTAIVAITAVDIFITRGWISRGVALYFFGDAAEHNRAKTPEGRAEQDKRSRTQIANGIIWEGIGAITGRFVKGITLAIPRPYHIDIGGYGRYPDAKNYTTSPVDYEGKPIPNLVQGYAEINLKNVPSNDVDIITIENAPFHDAIMTEATRVLKPNGTLQIQTNSEIVKPGMFEEIAKKFNLKLEGVQSMKVPDAAGGTFEQQTATFTKPGKQ